MAPRQRSILIRQFITDIVERHPREIAKMTSEYFGLTRQAARNHLNTLEKEGVLKSFGNTRAKYFQLCPLVKHSETYKTKGLEEDIPWSQDFRPRLVSIVPSNVLEICGIAFTEMVNNAIDHSESKTVSVQMMCTAATVSLKILDQGVGIFKKVKEAFGLVDERQSILELAKGRMTTNPGTHSGYGIFFTSRMSDIFSIRSGNLFFTYIQPNSDWLIEDHEDNLDGTYVEITLSMSKTKTAGDVYEEYVAAGDEEMSFNKTHVPVCLAQYGEERLISRSQAKRILARFEKFKEVLFDFNGVGFIGQAFADEIFRVFASQHPGIRIASMNANPQVSQMIRLAIGSRKDRQ